MVFAVGSSQKGYLVASLVPRLLCPGYGPGGWQGRGGAGHSSARNSLINDAIIKKEIDLQITGSKSTQARVRHLRCDTRSRKLFRGIQSFFHNHCIRALCHTSRAQELGVVKVGDVKSYQLMLMKMADTSR